MKDVVRFIFRSMMRNKYLRRFLFNLKKRGLLRKAIWRRLPVEFKFTVDIPGNGSFHYSSVAYDNIGRLLYWEGWDALEPETIPVFINLAKKADVILDIGSNTGLYTLLACSVNHSVKVLAFEPVPNIYYLLENNVNINNYANQCDLYQIALADYNALADFSVLTHDVHNVPTSSSLHVDGFRNRTHKTITVEVATVDAICSKHHNVNIDLIKIDVEGFEDKVLLGMKKILSLHQPALIVECTPDGPYKNVEQIVKNAGYKIYHLTSAGVIPVEHIEPDRNERNRNFLCVRNNKAFNDKSAIN